MSDAFTQCYSAGCPAGQYDTGVVWGLGASRPKICKSCALPCVECKSVSTNCTLCFTGSYLGKGSGGSGVCLLCSSADVNCLECKAGECTRCVKGYVEVWNKSLLCEKCQGIVSQCLDCKNGLTGKVECASCSSGYAVSFDKLKCVNCSTIVRCATCSD